MRILSAGIQHETNTFATTLTTTADFARDSHLGNEFSGGAAIVARYQDTNTIHGGYLVGAAVAGFEIVTLFNVHACPSGMVTRDCFEELVGEMISRITAALPADGVLLDLHGAMVTEDFEDAEAEIVRRVREVVGEATPVVVTLDLHANISRPLVQRSTVIIGFDTYPHVDMGDRGREAALLIKRIVDGEVQPQQAFVQLPMLTVPPMQCTLREPMANIIEQLNALEQRPGILTATIAMGFPFADIACMGVSVLVTSDGDMGVAEAAADEIAGWLWDARTALQPDLVTVEKAMEMAAVVNGLVILADGSDNPGGGAPCDGTVALQALIDADFQGGIVGLIVDPETVEQAVAAGVGGAIDVCLGAKTDTLHGESVLATAEVLALSDGEYVYGGPMAQGISDTLGPTTLLKIGGVQVIVSSLRRQLIDRNMAATVGVDFADFKLLVLKSAVHFRADIGPLAELILDADTPGVHRPDFSCFDYKYVRQDVYPLNVEC
ncbi:MAG: M81 family metallopeptidase [Planctomycetaceae bacterium]|jgi:microcystin degradation protein MlrC|nr:M81 family metallopeptidase [Planctomycetaceae bacterium]MBT4724078.1 M81 family metallopeptidase [Planctomycetaceae bacterium]MBT5124219.1 M81 family metallopeptidase [Planctomycetaceae bacterium]MBT5597372.1 M81 family metallopeptidase [Planctomycetaceae bacterium]MBT5883491.1 M81 family metallopeptidase [Planctomycetaceae bacterium]